jgi:hypothetical protein
MTGERKSHPYLRVWVADIVQSCQEMTPRQFGAHVRMLLHAWDRGYCSADTGKLAAITGPVPAEEMLDVLDRWQRKTIDGVRGEVLVNGRLERERQVMIEQATARSAAAQKANAIRWGSQSDPPRIRDGSQTDPTPDSILQTPDDRGETPSEVCSATRDARAKPADTIAWSFDDGWTGISEKDRTDWGIAYPAVDLDVELVRADQWLKGHPAQARKKLWRAFLTRWFGKEQERGGSRKVTPAGAPRPPEQYRPFNAPEDCDPSDYHRFRTPDGRPCSPSIYLTKSGRKRFITGEWYDDVIGGPPALPPAQTADEIALWGKISPRRGSQSDVA